mgnify:CR=1 FL=1
MKSNIKIAFRESRQSPGLSNYPSVINKILTARGIKSAEDIDYSLNTLIPYHSLNDIEKASNKLANAIINNNKIIVVADYDADGATSCALCIKAIKAFGNCNVDYIVPSRFSHGYGLSEELVDECYKQGAQLIVTVDNGITSIRGIERANALGIPVIVTDHHLPGEELPEALALVNPRVGAEEELINLAGVGVAFYLMLAVRAVLRDKKWFKEKGLEEPNLANYLDLVALGTVADIAILDKNNRTLVSQGLERIKYRRCSSGISALLEISKRQSASVDAFDLGFAIGPRLNAAGRLEDMALGIECLLAESYGGAIELATQLHQLNDERKNIEDDMKLEALAILDKQLEQGIDAENTLSICLYREEWHQGVIGILASRIKDRTHRPAVIFARGDDGNLKGSARSIQGIHIRDVFEAIDALHPGIIIKFGGHAMAAGITIAPEQFELFTQAFEAVVSEVSTPELFENIVLVDGELSGSEFSIELADQIKKLGPWGHHFPQPQFYGKFDVLHADVLKEKHLKMKLQTQSGVVLSAIAFNCIDSDWSGIPNQVDLVYRLDINEFRGTSSLQLMIDQINDIY